MTTTVSVPIQVIHLSLHEAYPFPLCNYKGSGVLHIPTHLFPHFPEVVLNLHLLLCMYIENGYPLGCEFSRAQPVECTYFVWKGRYLNEHVEERLKASNIDRYTIYGSYKVTKFR